MSGSRPPRDLRNEDERRARGLALADSLLESGKALGPLADAAHAQIKRRLLARTRRPAFRRALWLRPVVVVSLCLACGAAFGIALDRVVLKRGTDPGRAHPDDGVAGRGRARASQPAPKPTPAPAAEIPVAALGLGGDVAAPNAAPATAPPPVALPGEMASPGHAPGHARRVALLAEPSRRELTPPPPAPPSLAPVAPVGVPSAGVAPAASPGPAPAPGPPTTVAPAATTAPAHDDEGAPLAADGRSEERLLAAAVRALRARTDPGSALAALDEYKAHYPTGRLRVEAEILRVDALAALHRTPEMLRVLDGLDFTRMPGGLDRQLQRGELRAAAGRAPEAEADFTAVLTRAGAQDASECERALWNRARSRAGRGDANAARGDADEYLRRFPRGRFATEAAHLGTAVAP